MKSALITILTLAINLTHPICSAEPMLKAIELDTQILWPNESLHQVISFDKSSYLTESYGITKWPTGRIVVNVNERDVFIALRIKIRTGKIGDFNTIYRSDSSFQISGYSSSGSRKRLDPLNAYSARIRVPQMWHKWDDDKYTTSALDRNSNEWDVTLFGDDQMAVAQQSMDNSFVTIWIYSSGDGLGIFPTEGLRRLGANSPWYMYATCSLKTNGRFSLLYANQALWLLNDNYIAPVTSDATAQASNRYLEHEQSLIAFMGEPKELQWEKFSNSSINNVLFLNKERGEFSVINAEQEIITGNFTNSDLKLRRENSNTTRSAFVKATLSKINSLK